METYGDILNRLATTNTSSEQDGQIFQQLLRLAGFTHAIVTCGIVYLEGQGTLQAPPMSINQVAQVILKQINGGN